VLAHYAHLSANLDRQMQRLARRLGIPVPPERWPALVTAATFPHMRSRSSLLAQGPPGILLDDTEFFRESRSGGGPASLTAAELAHYQAKAASMAPAGARAWLHRQ
jgi:hypothetical protein